MHRSRTMTIAGAGPAGLTAAINLARAGYDVVVHEQHADVGMRFSEDFQALENWTSDEDVLDTIRRIGLTTNFYCHPIHQVSSFGPRTSTRVRFTQPIGYLIRRGCAARSLDASLKQQALECGVRLQFGNRVNPSIADILATGPHRAQVIAVGTIFDTDDQVRAAVLLDDEIAPKGYAYLLTASGHGTLAVVSYKQVKQARAGLDAATTRFCKHLGIDLRNPRSFSGYGDFDLRRLTKDEQQTAVGEAAGFQDFLFGFGIRYAMLSGDLAARSIIDRLDYQTLWQQAFGRHLRASLVNRFWYELGGQRGYDFLVHRSGRPRDPRQFWRNIYTKPFLRMLAYPLALQFTHPSRRT